MIYLPLGTNSATKFSFYALGANVACLKHYVGNKLLWERGRYTSVNGELLLAPMFPEYHVFYNNCFCIVYIKV